MNAELAKAFINYIQNIDTAFFWKFGRHSDEYTKVHIAGERLKLELMKLAVTQTPPPASESERPKT